MIAYEDFWWSPIVTAVHFIFTFFDRSQNATLPPPLSIIPIFLCFLMDAHSRFLTSAPFLSKWLLRSLDGLSGSSRATFSIINSEWRLSTVFTCASLRPSSYLSTSVQFSQLYVNNIFLLSFDSVLSALFNRFLRCEIMRKCALVIQIKKARDEHGLFPFFADCFLRTSSWYKMNNNCAFCSGDCRNGCVKALNEMNRADRFAYLLESLGTCSESPTYYEDIVWLVQRIVQVSLSCVWYALTFEEFCSWD